ncbi:Elongin-A [Seiridium cupressi]
MPAHPTLSQAYTAIRNLGLPNSRKEINDVGGLPYHIVRPILLRIDNAVQLRTIEEASPHIALDDEECWRRLIEKNFAVLHAQHDMVPRNPASWHKVYARYAKINAKAKAEAEAKLRAAFAGIQKKKAENSSSIESYQKLPRPPRDMKNVGRKAAVGRRGGSSDTGELKFTAGSRTKTTSGASVMRRVKREAAEVAARNRLATPNGALRVREGQIKKAPKGMVHEQSVKKNPAVKALPPTAQSREDEYRDRQMEEREERLRKLKAKGANILEDSDVDEDDEDDVFGGGRLNVDDLEELFDDDDEPVKPDPPRRLAALPGKNRGLLSNAYRGTSSATVQKVPSSTSTVNRPASKPVAHEVAPQPKVSTTSRPTTTLSSPPVGHTSPEKSAPSANGPSGSPEPRPRMPIKRKAVDVFMKPKPKTQRR